MTEISTERKLSGYEKMIRIINSYELAPSVTNLLIVYFEKWLNRKGRYEDADQLHGNKVRQLIGELISFHLSEDDEITCIQNSIDHEYYKFFIPNNGTSLCNNPAVNTSKSSFIQFDKNSVVSGSFTQDDINLIKSNALQNENEGKKSIY